MKRIAVFGVMALFFIVFSSAYLFCDPEIEDCQNIIDRVWDNYAIFKKDKNIFVNFTIPDNATGSDVQLKAFIPPWTSFNLSCYGGGTWQTVVSTEEGLERLSLAPICSPKPNIYRIWRINNPNKIPVTYSWQLYGSSLNGSAVAYPGESYINTTAISGLNTLRIFVRSKLHDMRSSDSSTCFQDYKSTFFLNENYTVPASCMADEELQLHFRAFGKGIFTPVWIYELTVWWTSVSYSEFTGKGETTDLSNLTSGDQEMPDLVLDDGIDGKITFNIPVGINASINFDEAVEISYASISVDTERYPSLNAPANLTMENLAMMSPLILRDGVRCLTCQILSWDTGTGRLHFSVPGFSTYTAVDGAQLEIWDDTNDVQGENTDHYEFELTGFYANFSDTAGFSVNGTGIFCNYTQNSTGSWSFPLEMDFDNISHLYEVNETFPFPGEFFFNVSCITNTLFNVSATDNFAITSSLTINEHYSDPSQPIEEEITHILANVTANLPIRWVNFTLTAPNGTIIIDNENATSVLWDLYNSSDFSAAGSGRWVWNISAYDNYSIANTSGSFSIQAWHIIVGNLSGSLILGNSLGKAITEWTVSNSSGSNIYVADSDSTLNFDSLIALGRNLSNSSRFGDFVELDDLMATTNLTDSVNRTFTSGGSVKKEHNFTVFGSTIYYTPIVNSTNVTTFFTGILWDSSDDDNGGTVGEYDSADQEDVVFITEATEPSDGSYGYYAFEISIPARLRAYVSGGDPNSVSLYGEIR
ncbi:hypothetical protein GOV09_03345 [Candidatus Woesearchaeota archaeon]|nr:hypothetical protein [Candidatus Woesearchaeota archaeon]